MYDLQIVVGCARDECPRYSNANARRLSGCVAVFGVPHLGVFDREGCRAVELAILTRDGKDAALHLTVK